VAKTRGSKKKGYLHKLKPGDILNVSIGGRIAESLPAKAVEEFFRAGTQAVQGGYTHSAIYVGNGEVVEAKMGDGVQKRPLKEAMKGLSFSVHRPTLPSKDRHEAARFAKDQVGKPYDGTALMVSVAGAVVPQWITNLVDKKIVAPPRGGSAYTCSNLVTAAYHKAQLTGAERLVAPGDLRASDKLKLVVAVHKKDFEEGSPWRGSRIRSRWSGRDQVTSDTKFTKRGSMLPPSQFDAFADELQKLGSISIDPGVGGGMLNRAAGAVKRYAGHMSGSTLRGASAGLKKARSAEQMTGFMDKARRSRGHVGLGGALSNSVSKRVAAEQAVGAARTGRNRAMAGTAAAIGVPLAAGAAWKAKQSLDQNKYASFEEATELAIEKLAAMSKQEQKRKRHEYYVQNRNKLRQQGRAWRQANKAQIQRKGRFYRKQVSTGARRQRQRVDTGGMSFTYMGYK
jgi:uncharacterized protein YycO